MSYKSTLNAMPRTSCDSSGGPLRASLQSQDLPS